MSEIHTAKLDWITPDAQKVVARHARVSTEDPERDKYEGLLKYCIQHGHWSVFEQVSCSFEVITTRAISAQILRHRTFTFQELSQRYCDPKKVLDLKEKPFRFDLRFQAEKNRQSSSDKIPMKLQEEFWDRLEIFDDIVHDLYEDMIRAGVARECARNMLPLYTPTKIHIAGTIRSFIHYVGLRGQDETQLEHRNIARSIGTELNYQIPIIIAAVRNSEDKSLKGWDFLDD